MDKILEGNHDDNIDEQYGAEKEEMRDNVMYCCSYYGQPMLFNIFHRIQMMADT